jgi:hypothetical protein
VVKGESELLDLPPGEPSGLRGVVASARVAPDRSRFVENRNGVAAGVALRIRVDPEEPPDPDFDPRFLGDLASATLLGRLSRVAEAARERPPTPEGRAPAADEKEAAAAVADPGVHGQAGPLRGAHGARP